MVICSVIEPGAPGTVGFIKKNNREKELVSWIKKTFVNEPGNPNLQSLLIIIMNYFLIETKSNDQTFSICGDHVIYQYLLLLSSYFI